jgi:hypothetical protein
MFRPIALICALFSASAIAGVIVGHPVHTEFASGAGLTYTSGSIQVTDQVVHFCNDTQLTIEIDDTVEMGDDVLLPEGTICGVVFQLDGPTLLAGTGTSGGSFTLQLNIPSILIEVDPPLTVSSSGTSDADAVQLGAPDFVTATLLQLGPGITRTVTPSHALHDQLAASIRYDSTILE